VIEWEKTTTRAGKTKDGSEELGCQLRNRMVRKISRHTGIAKWNLANICSAAAQGSSTAPPAQHSTAPRPSSLTLAPPLTVPLSLAKQNGPGQTLGLFRELPCAPSAACPSSYKYQVGRAAAHTTLSTGAVSGFCPFALNFALAIPLARFALHIPTLDTSKRRIDASTHRRIDESWLVA